MDSQRYKVTDRLDAGGMAEVFRGIAESSVGGLKRAVAIKRILPNLTKNKRFVQMFLDEARLALHLQHTNIVLVYDVGSAGAGEDAASAAPEGMRADTPRGSLARSNPALPTRVLLPPSAGGHRHAHPRLKP